MIFSLKLYHHYFKIEVKKIFRAICSVKVYYFIQGTLDNFFFQKYIYLRAFFLVIETNVYSNFLSRVYIEVETRITAILENCSVKNDLNHFWIILLVFLWLSAYKLVIWFVFRILKLTVITVDFSNHFSKDCTDDS